MTYSSDAEIDRLAKRFIDRTLPKAEWTHAAHFAVAVWLIRGDAYDADADMPTMIRAYNVAVGTVNSDTEGYHETITRASLAAARAFVADAEADAPLHEIIDALLSSTFARSGWLLDHWSKSVLFSTEARKRWIPPDLAPLPFPVSGCVSN